MHLFEGLAGFLAGGLHSELGTEDIAQLGSIAIPTSRHLLLVIVVVGGGEEGPEYQLGHIHFLLAVHLYRDTATVVADTDQVLFTGEWCIYMYIGVACGGVWCAVWHLVVRSGMWWCVVCSVAFGGAEWHVN